MSKEKPSKENLNKNKPNNQSDFDKNSEPDRKNDLDSRTIDKGIYQHYKGSEYEVLGTAYHSETEDLMVLYRPLYGNRDLWVRPFDLFIEPAFIDGKEIARFQLLKEK